MTGCRHGRRGRMPLGIDAFVNERGYTTVAVAVALLVSVALVFCVATAEWTLSRSSDVQTMADVAAVAGSKVVSSYLGVARTTDACVLSMGLAGMTVMGAGLIMAAIPGVRGASTEVLRTGKSILDSRNRFARSAGKGLRVLEAAVPGLIVANSWRCVKANDEGNAGYAGAALPFPLQSLSDFSALGDDVTTEGLEESAERLQDTADEVRKAKERAEEALERAWKADCVDDPRCMRSRASKLAGLSGTQNPNFASPQSWTFGVAIQRSRAYYARRLATEAPEAGDIESVVDSLARSAFYEYALEEVRSAWYQEAADGSVSLYVPHLACTTDEARQTRLYTDAIWPCTQEEEGRTLHATRSCPGATGADDGIDSVSAIDRGAARKCSTCAFDIKDLGAVARISTIANNGYEHYWQIVVEEAQNYQKARNEQAKAEKRLRKIAKEGSDAFEDALSQLETPRPRICPPGAWGCVSVASRAGGRDVPTELTAAFLSSQTLPAGVAVSAAALAPDDATSGNTVLTHLLAEVGGGGSSLTGSLLGGIARLWGELLVSYGAGYGELGSFAGEFLDKVDGIFGGTAGAWLKRRVAAAMASLGLEPADMRVRKPVLVSFEDVLGKAGIDPDGKVAELVRWLPSERSPAAIARKVGTWVWDQSQGSIEVAELPVPGTELRIPLSVDLSRWEV